ncbi:hypothetical protein BH10PLA2_BH10PLA2_10590 [soil metagenome]
MLVRFKTKFRLDAERWREDLLSIMLRVMLILGVIVYIPSVYLSIVSGLLGLALIDTLAIGTVGALLYFRRLPFLWRSALLGLTLYLVGIGLLISVGTICQIYFFGFSLVTAILLGRKTGLCSSLLSSLTLLAVGYFGYAAPELAPSGWHFDLAALFVITLNFSLVNVLLILVIGAVLAALEKALSREIEAHTALQQERTLLRTLIDTLPDAVFTKDNCGRFLSGNKAALNLVGVTSEAELVGKSVFDLYPRELAESVQKEDLQILTGSPLLDREFYDSFRPGEPAWYWMVKVPLRNPANEIIGLIGISRNITDRKQIESQRDRVLEQLQLQIERMPLAYCLMDSQFRFTRWNPAAEKMFGYTEAEVVGKRPCDVIVPPALQATAASVFEKIQAGDMNVHGEFKNRLKDGGTVNCEWHNTPMVDERGEFAGVMALAQDITERKNLAEQLQQARKLEAIGQLAGGIAHDFNNLLTIIIGHSELLLANPELGGPVRGPIQSIRSAGGRAADLTQQLLAFGRRSMLEPRILDLNAILAAKDKMLRRLLGDSIEFTTVLDPLLSRVRVDPGQLDQVLMNLAGNARDAMPRGGTFTIETSNVELSDDYAATHPECKTGHHVMLALTDTGCGMTPEMRSRIFEPFFTTKGVGQGSGLGLPVVFGIVKQSGGSINVYSEPNRGSTFKIYFPAERIPLTRQELPPAKLPCEGTETILLVEDEEGVRTLILTGLKMLGYRVLVASDGEDALRVASSHMGSIEVLLTDVIMPNMKGPQLAEQLRVRFPQMHILFMSGYTGDAVVRNGLLQPGTEFIQKPCTPSMLALKLRHLLDER